MVCTGRPFSDISAIVAHGDYNTDSGSICCIQGILYELTWPEAAQAHIDNVCMSLTDLFPVIVVTCHIVDGLGQTLVIIMLGVIEHID